jgi:hypothetical protein
MMKTPRPRVLEQITGYSNAVASIKSWVQAFNESNGAGRMTVSGSGLKATDVEGSGEYYEAHCTNINEAESQDEEHYIILTGW